MVIVKNDLGRFVGKRYKWRSDGDSFPNSCCEILSIDAYGGYFSYTYRPTPNVPEDLGRRLHGTTFTRSLVDCMNDMEFLEGGV